MGIGHISSLCAITYFNPTCLQNVDMIFWVVFSPVTGVKFVQTKRRVKRAPSQTELIHASCVSAGFVAQGRNLCSPLPWIVLRECCCYLPWSELVRFFFHCIGNTHNYHVFCCCCLFCRSYSLSVCFHTTMPKGRAGEIWCHLIPLYYLLSCSSALSCYSPSQPYLFFLFFSACWSIPLNFFSENSSSIFVKR